MFGIGGFELFIILIFGFLIFGPDKLPEVAKTVGKGIARFREAQQEMNDTLGGEKIFDPNNPDEPFKDPVEVLDKIAQRQEEKKRGAQAGKGEKPAAGSSAGSPGEAARAQAPSADSAASATDGGEAKTESFTERKARYERERAARKAAEREAAQAASAQNSTADDKTGSTAASPSGPADEEPGSHPTGAHSETPAQALSEDSGNASKSADAAPSRQAVSGGEGHLAGLRPDASADDASASAPSASEGGES